jgi:hypothetical protein
MTLVEKIDTSRYEYPTPTVWADDGYEFMQKSREQAGWYDVGSWGRDGWNLGVWPLVIVQHRDPSPLIGTFDVLYYVEGDITIYRYDTREERDAKTDVLFVFHALDSSHPVADELAKLGITWETRGSVEEMLDRLPAYLRGPYSVGRSGEE